LIDRYDIIEVLDNKGEKMIKSSLAGLEKVIIERAKKEKDHDRRCHKALVKAFKDMTEPTHLLKIIDSIELKHPDLSLSSLAAIALNMSDKGELVYIDLTTASLLSWSVEKANV
jgi:hypothetical protein